MTKGFVAIAVCTLIIAGCGNDIECEPDADFYKLFENRNHPTNKEAMQRVTCKDSEGNRY